MKIVLVYDSCYGNTERIARGIAEQVCAHLIRVTEAEIFEPPQCDLLIVAGPTHRQKTSEAMRAWLERLPRKALRDVPVATFDTRYRMSRYLSGSAAVRIAHRLTKAGELLHRT